MTLPWLALLAATPSVGLFVAATEGVSADDRSYLIASFAASLERETGQTPVLDEFATSADELVSRTGVTSVVTVKMFSGTQLARIAIEYRPEGDDPKSLHLDLPRDRDSWAPTLDGVARVLFPLTVAPRATRPATPAERSTALGWAGVGGGAALVVAGVALRVIAEGHRVDAEAAAERGDVAAAMDARDRNANFGLASNLSVLVGAVLTTAGVVFLGAGP
ncbi:MAG: hypothetical protein RIT81_27405 [Deltaproteobacteria bacterium]